MVVISAIVDETNGSTGRPSVSIVLPCQGAVSSRERHGKRTLRSVSRGLGCEWSGKRGIGDVGGAFGLRLFGGTFQGGAETLSTFIQRVGRSKSDIMNPTVLILDTSHRLWQSCAWLIGANFPLFVRIRISNPDPL